MHSHRKLLITLDFTFEIFRLVGYGDSFPKAKTNAFQVIDKYRPIAKQYNVRIIDGRLSNQAKPKTGDTEMMNKLLAIRSTCQEMRSDALRDHRESKVTQAASLFFIRRLNEIKKLESTAIYIVIDKR